MRRVKQHLMQTAQRKVTALPVSYTHLDVYKRQDESRARDAIRLAKDFRAKAKNTELIKKSPEKGLEDYIRFGKEYYAGSLVYIKKSGEITMVNLVTGEQKEVRCV